MLVVKHFALPSDTTKNVPFEHFLREVNQNEMLQKHMHVSYRATVVQYKLVFKAFSSVYMNSLTLGDFLLLQTPTVERTRTHVYDNSA